MVEGLPHAKELGLFKKNKQGQEWVFSMLEQERIIKG